MLIVDDGILTLLDQQLDKVTEAAAELFPKLTWKDISVLVNVSNEFYSIGSTVLKVDHSSPGVTSGYSPDSSSNSSVICLMMSACSIELCM